MIDRIMDRVEQGEPDACWPWRLSLMANGYGQVGWYDAEAKKNAMTPAHRVVWVWANGPIPPGLTVDHLCRTRSCCNPRHLRLLTNVANATDNGKATSHCPQGHSYEGTNPIVDRLGHRKCRTCVNERKRRAYARTVGR